MILTLLQKKLEQRPQFYNLQGLKVCTSSILIFPLGTGEVDMCSYAGTPMTLMSSSPPCSCREPQYTFSKPLYSQFKLPISPSPDAIWEAHRSLSTSVASDCDAETKWSWKIVPKPRNGACHFQHLNSWTVETYCIAACYVGLIVWESWPK